MLVNENNKIANYYLSSVVKYHKTQPEFKKRPVTTFLIEKTKHFTGLKIGESFISINFFFIFFTGILIYRISLLFEKNIKLATTNVFVYFLCFSNLFAFFPPIFTYDEPIQFSLILLSLLFFYKEKWLGYIVFFSLSLIVRESGLILLPGLIYLLHEKNIKNLLDSFRKKHLKKWAYLFVPVVIYFSYLLIINKTNIISINSTNDVSSRLSLYSYNTQSQKTAIESLLSFFLILGLPIYLTFYGLKIKNTENEKYINAFLVTVILNSTVVFTLTMAREARLFTIPMLFIWPIFSKIFIEDIRLLFTLNNYKLIFYNFNNVVSFIFLNFLNYTLSFKAYETSIGKPKENYFNEYLFTLILVIITHTILKYNMKKKLLNL
tara:strand:+ start:251 stop:1384 length:1134 start_codon:yes stop_codon:yes gene_type:complete